MSLMSDSASSDSGTDMRRPTANDEIGSHRPFKFVPKELTIKCRQLIESYHAIYGYVGLPDMLWLSDARDVIECDHELTQIFRKASKSRGAKRANVFFLHIATAIVSLEVLARDFADWGKRFPDARQEAEKVLGDYPQRQRIWLLDLYLYPPVGVRREFAKALALPAGEPPEPTKN
jgi:hypothetical protein